MAASHLNACLSIPFLLELEGTKAERYTVHQHHKTLGKFICIATAKDHLTINADPYKNFHPKSEEPDRVFLTDDKLEIIERLTFPNDKSYLNRIQNIFLASCCTGLRFSDITKVKLGVREARCESKKV